MRKTWLLLFRWEKIDEYADFKKKQERVILFYAMLTTNDAAALMGNIIYAIYAMSLFYYSSVHLMFGLAYIILVELFGYIW